MKDKYLIGLLFILVFLSVFSVYALCPKIEGDSLLYVNSIKVLETGEHPTDFVPMMIISTFLGLKLIMFISFFIGDIAISWSILNGLLFISMGLFFYLLLERIFRDKITAFLGTLFLATNYAAISFGMAYMMDVGGWAFYLASVYFSYLYLTSENLESKWLYMSSALIGLGGLYKEYAFVAFVVLFGVLIFRNWGNLKEIIKKIVLAGTLAFTPFLIMNIYSFLNFDGYTYINWFMYNQNAYVYQNRLVEFIKSFGSIYNFGWPLFIPGFYLFLRRIKETFSDKNLFFIWLLVVSSFAVILWPVVTRVLFITMPATILISCLFIQKINKYFVYSLLVIYAVSNFLMDAIILDWINIDSLLSLIR